MYILCTRLVMCGFNNLHPWRNHWLKNYEYKISKENLINKGSNTKLIRATSKILFHHLPLQRFFLFLYFLFPFFTKIYFRFGNLQKYTPAARLPGGRDLAARLPGGRGLPVKKRRKQIADRSLGIGRPAAGRPAS